MVTAVESAPEGTGEGMGAEGVSAKAYQNIHFLMTKMDTWIYDCVIEQRCPRTSMKIESCSGCKELVPQHLSIPLRTNRKDIVAPHAHELPRALRAQMEGVVAILERI